MALIRLFILLLFFIIGPHEVTSYLERSSLWTWSCHTKQEQCKREPLINNPTNGYSSKLSNNYNSLDVCRLTCGTYGALWPKPNGYVTISSQVTPIHFSKIYFEYADTTNEVQLYLKDVSQIFVQNLVQECKDNCNIIPDNNVTVYVSTISPDLVLSLTTDESYNLEVTTKANRIKVQINAHTVFGARHALETLSQLVASYQTLATSSTESKEGLVMVSEAKITDTPVYAYRALLLDTARNFMPIETIKRQLDAMGASKMNILHWHVTDAQSFPLESPRVPQMTQYGAYSADQIYTPSQITDLLSYALRRGVRIIIELDAPSHSGNGWQWGPTVGLGDLAVCVNHIPWRGFCIQPPCGQLNPANNHVYKVLADLYRDILDLVPQNEIIHMGGDEVWIPCWNSSDEIVNYLKSQGKGRETADFLSLWGEFQGKALQNLDEQAGHNNTPVMVWTSHLTDPSVIEKYLDKNRYIIETWVPSSDELPNNLLKLGYRLVISTKDAWYLDHGFWGTTQYYPWRKVYKNKLPNDEKVLGGEVCMWSEYVDNEAVDSKVWPRAAAAAERLWSNPTTDPDAAEARMYRHRERLVQRGIGAEALAPEWCFQNEGECL